MIRFLPGLLASALLMASAPVTADAQAAGTTTFELGKLNGDWVDMAPALAPIERGPLRVTIHSPHHRVRVHRNRLRLSRLDRGRVGADFEVELEGEGTLVADLQAGIKQRIEDHVIVPRQTLRITGVIRLAEEAGGWRITFEEMPDQLEVAIESRWLGQLVATCRGFGSFLPIDCEAFERDLQTARIPMPRPGEHVLLPNTYLSDAERATFVRFAERTSQPGNGNPQH